MKSERLETEKTIDLVRAGSIILGLLLILGTLSSCGKVREAASVVKAVSEMAEVGERMMEDEFDSVDWDNYDLQESDVRKFYSGVLALQEAHPGIDFEMAIVAAIETMSEGINIQEAVEEETNMTFTEYNGLSAAVTMALAEAESARFTTEVVADMEEALDELESLDQKALTEEQKTVIEEQRNALAQAKAELESPEFQNRLERSTMVLGIREEMGF